MEKTDLLPPAQSSQFAWSADRDPDWWLTIIADLMRRTHTRARQGLVTDRDWDRLLTRCRDLVDIQERKEASQP